MKYLKQHLKNGKRSMNKFERGKESYRSLRIGSGRAIDVIWISMGGGAKMKHEQVVLMFVKWEMEKDTIPRGVYPLIKENSGIERFVETTDLIGELIKYRDNYYQL